LLYYIFIIIGLLLLGLILIIIRLIREANNQKDAYEYMNNFREYGNSLIVEKENYKLYEWLTMRAPKMQDKVGELGVARGFIPPFSGIQYMSYQILINALPTLRDEARSSIRGFNSIQNNIMHNYLTMIDDVLLRYIGVVENEIEKLKGQVKNPFLWLREGIQSIVHLPFLLLYWTGVIKYGTYYTISNNIIIKFINFLVIIIGLVSSIITIVTGYNPFTEILSTYVK
jgi:hypothetical protein